MELNNTCAHDAPDTDETIIFMAHTDSVIQSQLLMTSFRLRLFWKVCELFKKQRNSKVCCSCFTDGEEQGLLGSAKFISDHPEYKNRTRLVVNLEAQEFRRSHTVPDDRQ